MRKIHAVSVTDENSVVITITLEDSTASPCIFFAIMYAVGVLGDASMIISANSS